MKEFVAQNGGILGMIVMVAFALNFLLSGLSKMLEVFQDKTATNLDNKAVVLLNKIAGVLQKVIDWGSANRPH